MVWLAAHYCGRFLSPLSLSFRARVSVPGERKRVRRPCTSEICFSSCIQIIHTSCERSLSGRQSFVVCPAPLIENLDALKEIRSFDPKILVALFREERRVSPRTHLPQLVCRQSFVPLSHTSSPIFVKNINSPKPGSEPATMGGQLSKVIDRLFGAKEMRLLMLGLDAAGKTSLPLFPTLPSDSVRSLTALPAFQPSSIKLNSTKT
jgi:ADP-ribosylation factor family